MFKKIVSILLVLCTTLGLVACNPDSGPYIDHTKTQIYVSHFNGGFGSEWLSKIKTSFEETYKDVSFEEGKKGVQVVIKNHKDLGSKLTGTLPDNSNYVFILEDVPYNEYVYGEQILDITDVVTGTFDINEATGDNTIPDIEQSEKDILAKFNDIQVDSLKVEDKYWAIPHYEGYYGFTYDADLFDDNGFYMGYESEEYPDYDPENPDLSKVVFSPGYYSTDGEQLSPGPDGIHGTDDDGLPVTYDDFFALCEYMETNGVTPMVWSGQHQFYISNAINQLIADYNGYENEKLGYTFNGTSTKWVESFSGNTPVIKEKVITNENGYEYFKQAGLYYGLSFLEKLIDTDGYLYQDSFTGSFSHTDAQNTYLLSNKVPTMKPIAMLAEGVWWQNEASAQFSAMEKSYPNSGKMDRNLKFMPMPKATIEQVGEGTTLLESQNSFMMIKKNVDSKYVPLCKLFLQYMNTTDKLQEFTTTSNTPKALRYELTPTQKQSLTPFGRSVMDIKSGYNSDGTAKAVKPQVVYQLSTNPLYANNKSLFKRYETLAYGDNSYPSTAFNDTKSLTAKDYFLGLSSAWSSRWDDDFAKYI